MLLLKQATQRKWTNKLKGWRSNALTDLDKIYLTLTRRVHSKKPWLKKKDVESLALQSCIKFQARCTLRLRRTSGSSTNWCRRTRNLLISFHSHIILISTRSAIRMWIWMTLKLDLQTTLNILNLTSHPTRLIEASWILIKSITTLNSANWSLTRMLTN